MAKLKTAPSYLSAEASTWVNSVLREWGLEPHHEKILLLAAVAYDRAMDARRRIKKDGAILLCKNGDLKSHPAVAIERDSRLAFVRLIRELQLDTESEEAEAIRPPILYKNKIAREA